MPVRRPHVFVSHAMADVALARDVEAVLNRLPFEVRLIVDEDSTGRTQDTIAAALDDTDILLVVVTADSVDNTWVNQEVGYAFATDTELLPVFEDSDLLGGFLADMEGVKIREDRDRMFTRLLGKLRSRFDPTAIYEPDWFFVHECDADGCANVNRFAVNDSQQALYERSANDESLSYPCDACGTVHTFEPVTLAPKFRFSP